MTHNTIEVACQVKSCVQWVITETDDDDDDDLCNSTETCPKWMLIKQKKENYLAPTAPPGVSWTLTGSYKNDENC